MRHQGELLLGLGLVPPEFDYEEGTFRLLESQLAGFYEYRDKKMYVASDLDGPSTDQALAHELVHALQDQHYDLGIANLLPARSERPRNGISVARRRGRDERHAGRGATEHRRAVEMPGRSTRGRYRGSMSPSRATAPSRR